MKSRYFNSGIHPFIYGTLLKNFRDSDWWSEGHTTLFELISIFKV